MNMFKPTSAKTPEEYIAEKYKDTLPRASIGKSCIRFKKLADIDLKMLPKVILEGVRVMEK